MINRDSIVDSQFHSEVTVHIYDLTKHASLGVESGFYYSIPLSGQEEIGAGALPFLSRRFDTREEALAAARHFIDDAIAEHRALTEASMIDKGES